MVSLVVVMCRFWWLSSTCIHDTSCTVISNQRMSFSRRKQIFRRWA